MAFSAGDDASVLAATDGLSDRGAATVVLQTYRARALQRVRRLEPAVVVLTEAMTLARRLGDEGAGLVVPVRYLRARALLATGRTAEALRDLYAIQAAEADYLDVTDVLAAAAAAEPRRRGEIPERVRHEVWRRDQGRCMQCGSQEHLEIDHIIPWSRGGSDTARNLQLLCEKCNRRKSATI